MPENEPTEGIEVDIEEASMPDGSRIIAAFAPGVDADDAAEMMATLWAELPEDV